MADLADELIDGILRDFPGHQAGSRPIHAPGVCVTGRFRGDPVAPRYCIAEHLAGQWVPVTVRFSDGTGLPAVPAGDKPVRGMAVKFHLDDVRETDLVAMSIPVFFTRTVEAFKEFTAAACPAPIPRSPLWRRLADQLTLATVAPPPPQDRTESAEAGIFAFANAHPEAGPAVLAAGTQIAPASYTTLAYYAVHAFRLIAADGSPCWARLDWEPVAGIVTGTPGADLRPALDDALSSGRAQFVLRAQIADVDDDPADPTRPWPPHRRRVVLGQLWLDRRVTDQGTGCEQLSFNPARLVPGIEGHPDDPIFQVRGEVYARSHERRIAQTP
jgi:catalase